MGFVGKQLGPGKPHFPIAHRPDVGVADQMGEEGPARGQAPGQPAGREPDEQRGEHDHLVGPALRDAADDADRVPDQAEVTDVAGGAEEPIRDRVAAQPFEQFVDLGVERVDRRADEAGGGLRTGRESRGVSGLKRNRRCCPKKRFRKTAVRCLAGIPDGFVSNHP